VGEAARIEFKEGGAKPVSPSGTICIRTGSYNEPIVLNKIMEIRACDGTATIGPVPLAAFDLVADAVDNNGLPLNPKWGTQRSENVPPDPNQCHHGDSDDSFSCTNQFTYTDSGCHVLPPPIFRYCCGPHVNWFGATYQGTIFWDNHDCPFPCGDDDYNMRLVPENGAGLTANTDHIQVEFDSDETIDHFNSPFWSTFHRAVDDDGCSGSGGIPVLGRVPGCPGRSSGTRARQMINGGNGALAIVTGLVGLDCGEGCFSELHPAWALVMNVQPSTDDDLWVFFVRNWGDEGFCGTDQHLIDFPNNRYTLRIPWKGGATSVMVNSQTLHPSNFQNPPPPPEFRNVPGQGVFITFTLDAPRGGGSMWDGELHLQWR
jgi:hypothetical protein